jgi:DNA-binding transcriptional LysR family regulator
MLDRYLLRYFLAVVEQGNFSRAAAHCHVSQPTLSVGIAKLESLLGIQLFVRSSQRVELTGGGSQLLVHARRIEREFNLALQSLGKAENLPSLRLGVLSSIPGDIVAAAVTRARPERDHRLELLFGSERELVGHLAKDRIDVALTLIGRGADRFLEQPVCTESYALALPQSHPLAPSGDIAAEQLGSEAMIVRRHCEALSDLSRFFTERGLRPHFSLRSTNDERVMQMVAAGLGITVMPWSFRGPGVARPKLAGFDLRRSLGWAAGHAAEHLLASPPQIMVEFASEMSNRAKG